MTTFEMCPYCDEIDEYVIPENHLIVQCKHCGMYIQLCSVCDYKSCENCEIK